MSQGRTATVTKVTRNGHAFWRKNNEDPVITDLEHRIYTSLSEDDSFSLEAPVPLVEKDDDPHVLYIEDLGTSFVEALHGGARLDISNPAYLLRTVKIRAALNTIINRTLTTQDKNYLRESQKTALRTSIENISGTPVSDADLATHFWAYRMLQAVGVYNEPVRDAYTALIGRKLDSLMPRYGQWNADNCLRNNAVSHDGVVVIPFDFNSIRYELRQMDEASMASFYMFHGPLGSSANNAVSSILGWLHQRFSFETSHPGTVTKYTEAYMLGSVHKHMMLSGYRTQEMKGLYKELDAHLEKHGRIPRDTYLAFRMAFDEVEYHESLWQQSARACPDFVPCQDDVDRARLIYSFVFENTRLQRTSLMLTLVYDKGEQILASHR